MNKRQEILDELALTRTLSNESLAGMDFSQEDFSNYEPKKEPEGFGNYY